MRRGGLLCPELDSSFVCNGSARSHGPADLDDRLCQLFDPIGRPTRTWPRASAQTCQLCHVERRSCTAANTFSAVTATHRPGSAPRGWRAWALLGQGAGFTVVIG